MKAPTPYQPVCFIPFKEDLEKISFPSHFTFPFNYTPHPLSIKAAEALQTRLNQEDFAHDFEALGKMFGVLVVQDNKGKLGYLAAFSGKLGDKNSIKGFVPPVYDRLTNDGFFLDEEATITQINKEIKQLQQAEQYIALKQALHNTTEAAKLALEASKEAKQKAKIARDRQREKASKKLTNKEYLILNAQLEQESKAIFYEHKHLNKTWKERITEAKQALTDYEQRIEGLKQQRKTLSAQLQQKLFDQYQFLTKDGASRGLCSIFEEAINAVPPAGAGDCAAPKLLQYAFQHNLTPICMAEFWWGKSPKQEVRKHGHYYPACRGKCEPILGHMLQGMDLEPNPAAQKPNATSEITIIYEDEYLVAVNKPDKLLSVPGKVRKASVQTWAQTRYPDATGPLLVHRLDMATSGILLIAKLEEIHKALQAQFIERQVKKRYIALLDGVLPQPKGHIELPLRVDLDNRPHQLVCYTHGKPAKTTYEVIKEVDGQTLVYFYPFTGRTHQLRVHAAHQDGLNCPIVGDDLYGTSGERLYLHAEQLVFTHPVTQETMTLHVPANF